MIRENEQKLRREKRKKERQKKIERGLIDPEKEPEEEDSDGEPDPDEGVPLFIPESYHINSAFYSGDGHKFWLSMVTRNSTQFSTCLVVLNSVFCYSLVTMPASCMNVSLPLLKKPAMLRTMESLSDS